MTDPGRHEPERHVQAPDELDGQLPLWPPASGYLRHLVELYAGATSTSLPVADDDEAGQAPDDDGPWRLLQAVRLVPYPADTPA